MITLQIILLKNFFICNEGHAYYGYLTKTFKDSFHIQKAKYSIKKEDGFSQIEAFKANSRSGIYKSEREDDNTEKWSQTIQGGLQFISQKDGSLYAKVGAKVENVFSVLSGIVESFMKIGTSVILEGSIMDDIDQKFRDM